MDPLLSRITIDPAVCHGKPCVRGLRYPVETLLELLSSGMSIDEILADYEEQAKSTMPVVEQPLNGFDHRGNDSFDVTRTAAPDELVIFVRREERRNRVGKQHLRDDAIGLLLLPADLGVPIAGAPVAIAVQIITHH